MLAPLSFLVIAAGPILFTAGVEEPKKVERIDLPPQCAICPPGRVTCSRYAAFTVREVDLGDIGAELLAIAPHDPKKQPPACGRERMPGELSVTAGQETWCGYFEGARGNFAFFRSEEPRGGTRAFAAYDASTGQRVFTGEAVGPVSVRSHGERVAIGWLRRTLAPCSPLAGGDACWNRIKEELGVADPAPDCATSYREANEAAAKAACAEAGAGAPRCIEQELRLRPAVPAVVPPVLEYEVEVRDLAAPEMKAAPEKPVASCRPPE